MPGSMNWRWAALTGFLAVIAGTGIWLEGPWHQSQAGIAAGKAVGQSSCRLPLFVTGSNIAGFLTVPGYSFAAVPSTALSGGSKFGDGRWSYDAPLNRWLPVDYRLISPDGMWWMYQTMSEPSLTAAVAIHLVDRHGRDRTVWNGTGLAAPWGWTQHGAAFEHLAPHAKTAEVLVVDPASSRLQNLPGAPGEFAGLDATDVWGISDRLTAPPSNQDAPYHWTLSRTDLDTGVTVAWWDHPYMGIVQLVGFNAHHQPVVFLDPAGSDPARLLVLTAPNAEMELASLTAADQFQPMSEMADANGIWLGGLRDQLWRWTAKDGLRVVTHVPNDGNATSVIIAGPCR